MDQHWGASVVYYCLVYLRSWAKCNICFLVLNKVLLWHFHCKWNIIVKYFSYGREANISYRYVSILYGSFKEDTSENCRFYSLFLVMLLLLCPCGHYMAGNCNKMPLFILLISEPYISYTDSGREPTTPSREVWCVTQLHWWFSSLKHGAPSYLHDHHTCLWS